MINFQHFILTLLISITTAFMFASDSLSAQSGLTSDEQKRRDRISKRISTAVGRADISLARIEREAANQDKVISFISDLKQDYEFGSESIESDIHSIMRLLKKVRAFRQSAERFKHKACPQLRSEELVTGVPEWSDEVYFDLISGGPTNPTIANKLAHFEIITFMLEQETQKLEVIEDQFITLSTYDCRIDKQKTTEAKSKLEFSEATSLGPNLIINGEGHNKAPIPVSGRVPSLAIDKSSPENIFVGSAFGGIWRSKNRGETWLPLLDHSQISPIGSLSVSQHSLPVILAGTGEANVAFRDLVVKNDRLLAGGVGRGILRSTDYGESWNIVGKEFTNQSFAEIKFGEKNPDIAVAVGTMGVSLSTDAGLTWKNVTPEIEIQLPVVAGTSVALSPENADEAWVAMWGAGIFYTSNLLSSDRPDWKWLRNGLPLSNLARIEIDISRSNPNSIAALISNADHRLRGIYVSRDAGASWSKIDSAPDLLQGQGFYNMLLAFSPFTDKSLYYGGVGPRPEGASSLFFASENNTWNFTPIGSELHVDFHDIGFDPELPGTMYVSNDGGIWRSFDSGANWESINRGLQITQVMSVSRSPDGERLIYAGTQDNGTIRYSSVGDWLHVEDGDGGAVEVDLFDSNIVYTIFFQHKLTRSTQKGDEGTFIPRHPNLEQHGDMGLLAPFALNPFKPGELVLGADNVYVSSDRGDTWKKIDFNPSAPSSRVRKSVISSITYKTVNAFFVGTSNGEVWQIERQSSGWKQRLILRTSEALGFDGYISSIKFSENIGSILLSIQDDIHGGLIYIENIDVPVLEYFATYMPVYDVEKVSENVYVAGTLNGLVQYDKRSNRVFELTTDLPRVAAFDIDYDQARSELLVGTFGRGVWSVRVLD